MRFYNRQHRHYCGIDLQVKTMYICILDATGRVLVHRNVKATPDAFLEIVGLYRTTWSSQRNVCSRGTGSPMSVPPKASLCATLLQGGLLPQAYVYPGPCDRHWISCDVASTWCGSAASDECLSQPRALTLVVLGGLIQLELG